MTEEERARRMKWRDYWPVGAWFMLVIVPWSTFLYGIASVSMGSLRSREADLWFVVIASWNMIQFSYEIWFSGWIEKNFLLLKQRRAFYHRVRKRVSKAGWRRKAMEWVIGKIEDQMSRLHSKIRRFLYPVLFGWGAASSGTEAPVRLLVPGQAFHSRACIPGFRKYPSGLDRA